MRKLLIFTSFIFVLSACGEDRLTSIESRQDSTSARISWESMLTEAEQAVLCDIYFTTEHDDVVAMLQTRGNTPSEAAEYYQVLNEEC